MSIVRNDIAAMSDLIGRLQHFRSTTLDGEQRIRQMLAVDVGSAWRDDRFDRFQEELTTDLDQWHTLVGERIGALETIARRLRVRLEEYLYGTGPYAAPSAAATDASTTGDHAEVRVVVDLSIRLLPTSLPHNAPTLPNGFLDGAKQILFALLMKTTDHVARGLAMTLLARLGLAAPPTLLGLLQAPLLNFVLAGLGTANVHDHSVTAHLRSASRHSESEVRLNVIRASARRSDAESAAIIHSLANDPDPAVRHAARDAQIRRRAFDDAATLATGARHARPGSARQSVRHMRSMLAAARHNELPALAALRPDATVDEFLSARRALYRPNAAATTHLTMPSPAAASLASQTLLRSFRNDPETARQQIAAPHSVVRAAANCAAALHAAPSERMHLAATAVASADQSPDRGLFVAALLTQAAVAHAENRYDEAHASWAQALDAWTEMSALQRLDWQAEPLEETLLLARAVLVAGEVPADAVDGLLDLFGAAFLLLLRFCSGMLLGATFLIALVDFLLESFAPIDEPRL